jgi:AAA+ ATPase superfamily predicted ATPase
VLRSVAIAVSKQTPSIVVLDEVPWLVERDHEFEGALQTVWDRYLSAKPVLLLLVGSDLSVMESLQQYGRPFHGRAARMLVRPLDPADVRQMTALDPAKAIDAFLITGGFPEIVQRWQPGTSRTAFLRDQLADPLSPLLMAGELSLLSELPEPSHSRSALEAIGTDERTFSTIANRIGVGDPLPSGTLAPILNTLTAKRIVAIDTPLATRPDTKNKRYRIEDPYLRFWLAFLQRGLAEVERGRGDLVVTRIEQSWQSWRGRAVEPVIRAGLERLVEQAEQSGSRPDRRRPSPSRSEPHRLHRLDQVARERALRATRIRKPARRLHVSPWPRPHDAAGRRLPQRRRSGAAVGRFVRPGGHRRGLGALTTRWRVVGP